MAETGDLIKENRTPRWYLLLPMLLVMFSIGNFDQQTQTVMIFSVTMVGLIIDVERQKRKLNRIVEILEVEKIVQSKYRTDIEQINEILKDIEKSAEDKGSV